MSRGRGRSIDGADGEHGVFDRAATMAVNSNIGDRDLILISIGLFAREAIGESNRHRGGIGACMTFQSEVYLVFRTATGKKLKKETRKLIFVDKVNFLI